MADLLAYDPGLSTGWAWFRSLNDGPYVLYDFGVIGGGCEGFIAVTYGTWPYPDIIVSESFIPHGTALGEDGTHALQIEGVLKADAHSLRRSLIFQPPSDKAALIPSEKLRNQWITERFGKVPTQHARDAITHGIVWIKRNHKPSIEHYWPRHDKAPE